MRRKERSVRRGRSGGRGINTCAKAGTSRAARVCVGGRQDPFRHASMTNLGRPPSPFCKHERVAVAATDPSPRLNAGRGAAAPALPSVGRNLLPPGGPRWGAGQ